MDLKFRTDKAQFKEAERNITRLRTGLSKLTAPLLSLAGIAGSLGLGAITQAAKEASLAISRLNRDTITGRKALKRDFEEVRKETEGIEKGIVNVQKRLGRGAPTRTNLLETYRALLTGPIRDKNLIIDGGILETSAKAGVTFETSAAVFGSNVTKIQNAFGRRSSEDFQYIVDMISTLSAFINEDLGSFMQRLGRISPDAAKAKVSMQDTFAALGLLIEGGLVSERAGVGLRALFSRLSPGGSFGTVGDKVLSELTGGNVNQASLARNLQLGGGLAETLSALSGMTSGQADALVGRESGTALYMLMQGIASGAFADQRERQSRSNTFGSLDAGYKAFNQGLTVSFSELQRQFVDLAVAIGDTGLSAAMVQVLKFFTAIAKLGKGVLSITGIDYLIQALLALGTINLGIKGAKFLGQLGGTNLVLSNAGRIVQGAWRVGRDYRNPKMRGFFSKHGVRARDELKRRTRGNWAGFTGPLANIFGASNSAARRMREFEAFQAREAMLANYRSTSREDRRRIHQEYRSAREDRTKNSWAYAWGFGNSRSRRSMRPKSLINLGKSAAMLGRGLGLLGRGVGILMGGLFGGIGIALFSAAITALISNWPTISQWAPVKASLEWLKSILDWFVSWRIWNVLSGRSSGGGDMDILRKNIAPFNRDGTLKGGELSSMSTPLMSGRVAGIKSYNVGSVNIEMAGMSGDMKQIAMELKDNLTEQFHNVEQNFDSSIAA